LAGKDTRFDRRDESREALLEVLEDGVARAGLKEARH